MSDTSLAVEARALCKHYGSVEALKEVTLAIRDREFFTLLGPSGCGKTTLLRIIAGFESISQGALLLHGRDIAGLPANRRPVNTVFQQYSLFPHMSVADNVRFGMQMKKMPPAEIRRRTGEMLELVQLADFADRRPAQLSGGQQQRVALARALAPSPEVLLLDEPLSALDLKLRQAMRVELKQIQENAGITFIFVTHDQEEALTMSDRIAVMSAGEVQQVGSAHQIYQEPENRFVADFIGESNLLKSHVLDLDGEFLRCSLPGGGHLTLPRARPADIGQQGTLCIRPEHLSLREPRQSTDSHLRGRLVRRVYLGTATQLVIDIEHAEEVNVRVPNIEHADRLLPGQVVELSIHSPAVRFLTR